MTYELGLGFIIGSFIIASAILIIKTEGWLRVLMLAMYLGTILTGLTVAQTLVASNNASSNITSVLDTLLYVSIIVVWVIVGLLAIVTLYNALYYAYKSGKVKDERQL